MSEHRSLIAFVRRCCGRGVSNTPQHVHTPAWTSLPTLYSPIRIVACTACDEILPVSAMEESRPWLTRPPLRKLAEDDLRDIFDALAGLDPDLHDRLDRTLAAISRNSWMLVERYVESYPDDFRLVFKRGDEVRNVQVPQEVWRAFDA